MLLNTSVIEHINLYSLQTVDLFRNVTYNKKMLYSFRKQQENKKDKTDDGSGRGGFGGFGVAEVCSILCYFKTIEKLCDRKWQCFLSFDCLQCHCLSLAWADKKDSLCALFRKY